MRTRDRDHHPRPLTRMAPPRHANEDGLFDVSARLRAEALGVGEAVRLEAARGLSRPLHAMALNKLAVIAHGLHLARTGTPLCQERPLMREHGPVFESLRRRSLELVDLHGSSDLRGIEIAREGALRADDPRRASIAEAVRLHGGKDAEALSDLCHARGSAHHLAAMANGWTAEPYTAIADALFAFCWRNDPVNGCLLRIDALEPMSEAR